MLQQVTNAIETDMRVRIETGDDDNDVVFLDPSDCTLISVRDFVDKEKSSIVTRPTLIRPQ